MLKFKLFNSYFEIYEIERTKYSKIRTTVLDVVSTNAFLLFILVIRITKS